VLVCDWVETVSPDDQSDRRLKHRMIMDSIINSAGLAFIMIGFPIQVARQINPMDFVLNVIAAFAIIELDDIDTPKVLVKISGLQAFSKALEDEFQVIAKDFIHWINITAELNKVSTCPINKPLNFSALDTKYEEVMKDLANHLLTSRELARENLVESNTDSRRIDETIEDDSTIKEVKEQM